MDDDAHADDGALPSPARARPAPAGDGLRGRVLDGRYRIGDRVARGGMASVYEALDLRLHRTVAVKIMHAGLSDGHADQDFAERFVREARAAARLSHPHVVSVFDQGDDDGTVYLVMELVSGHTLRDTIAKESPMAPARALALLEPILSALAAAHRSGLIHRDVKPENVLIADDGRIKVADFGLAKAISADTQHTATQGVLIGTVSYLAPELVVDGRADARADVYAAGVMLYELLTGVKPHEGESPIQVAYKHVHHDVPPPSERVPDLPPYVDALVARATARSREQRPADAAVFLHQLHRVGHALADGVRDDPELTLDLSPHLAPRQPAPASAEPETVDGDTTPETFDDAALATFAVSDIRTPREHTTMLPTDPSAPQRPAIDRLSRPGPRQAPPPAPRDSHPSGPGGPGGPSGTGRRPRRSRRGPILLVLALALALAVGGGAYWFGYARYEAAPSVTGLDVGEAESTLADAGLEVAYTDAVYDRDVPADTVISADPKGGSRVQSGDTVTLTLSLGALEVPRLKGLEEDAAQAALVEAGLEIGDRSTRYSEKVPEGTVLQSTPKRGTEVDPGDTVSLVVSQGRRPLKVGRWVGKDIDDARRTLEDRGLSVEVSDQVYDDQAPAGQVLTQDPARGTLYRNETVSFTVSKGPELVEVPQVKAFGVTAATETLKAAGFVVDVKNNDGFYAGLGIAVSTDPQAGEMAPKGSTITLYVI